MSKVEGLTKKEAFQMILDKLFADEEITSEFLEDTFDKITENKPHTGIIKKLNDKFHENEKEEDRDVTQKPANNGHLKPDDEYVFPDSYKEPRDIVLTDDGYCTFEGSIQAKYSIQDILKIFFNIDYPVFLKRSYHKINDLELTVVNINTKMRIANAIMRSLKRGRGKTWDTIQEILDHEYSVPLGLTFSSANNTLYINGKDTHIFLDDVEKYTTRVNDSIHPYDEIILIMNEAKEIKNKKYLYYILKNSGNNHIGDILQNTTLKYDKYGRAVV